MTTKPQRDLVKEYLTYLQVEKGLARHTLDSYRRDLARLDRWAGKSDKAVADLTRPDLRKWIAQLSREGLAPSSVARAVSATRGFFRFLMLDGHIKHHPAEDLDTPQRFSYLPTFLTEDDIDRLFAVPDVSTEEGIQHRAMLELMYAAGLRVSEVVSLKQTEVDVHAGVVNCRKGSKERRVPSVRAPSTGCKIFDGKGLRTPLPKSFASRQATDAPASLDDDYDLREKDGPPECFATHFASRFATHLLQMALTRARFSFAWPQRYSTTQIYTHITDRHLRGLRQPPPTRAAVVAAN